jgi:hypothetical protein
MALVGCHGEKFSSRANESSAESNDAAIKQIRNLIWLLTFLSRFIRTSGNQNEKG